jgi:hypothetical protein
MDCFKKLKIELPIETNRSHPGNYWLQKRVDCVITGHKSVRLWYIGKAYCHRTTL